MLRNSQIKFIFIKNIFSGVSLGGGFRLVDLWIYCLSDLLELLWQPHTDFFLVFSYKKFHVIDVGFRRMHDCKLEQIVFGGGTPPVSRQAKLLGCMIDSKLSFKPHISMVTTKMEDVAFKLRKIAGTKSSVSPFQLYTVFRSYIFQMVT